MIRHILSGLLIVVIVSLIQSQSPVSAFSASDELVVVAWNVANFSDAKRANQAIAIDFLFDTYNVDILALQEVTNSPGNTPIIDPVISTLGGPTAFGHCVSKLGGGDKLAYIWNKATVSVTCSEVEEVALVGKGMGNNRPALVAEVNREAGFEGQFDFMIVNIHPRASDCPSSSSTCDGFTSAEDVRAAQFKEVADLVWSKLMAGSDLDVLVVGDFNEKADPDEHEGRLTLLDTLLDFRLTNQATTVSGSGIIDHIWPTDMAGGASQEMIGSPEVLRLHQDAQFCNLIGVCLSATFISSISDHYPVLARFQNNDSD